MATTKKPIQEEKTITLDLEVLLIPLSIILASIMISASIVYAFRDGTTTRTTTNTGDTATGGGSVESIVEAIDVNIDDFNACLAENDFTDEIENDRSEGTAAGVTGTPGFVIGKLDGDGNVSGAVISGAQPYAVFSETIDGYLNNEGEETAKVDIDDDPIKGNKDTAKVAVVEFSDYECPFCQRFHNDTYDQIISNYVDSGDVIYVYRDFPLSFHEPKASEAASAANCVREVAGDDKYYEFAKLYYEQTISNGEGLPS